MVERVKRWRVLSNGGLSMLRELPQMSHLVISWGRGRGKVMSQKANKLQAPILDNLIYSRHPFLKKVINSSEMTINSCECQKLKIIAYFDVNKQ